VKRDLRERPSLARQFVDWYLARIGHASKPIARIKLLFVLVTASFFVHFLVVYGEFIFVEPQKSSLSKFEEQKRTRVDVTARHLTKEQYEDLKKIAQLPTLLAEAEKKAAEEEKKLKEEEKKLKDEEKKKSEPTKEEPRKEEPKPNKSVAPQAKKDTDVARKVLDITEEDKKKAKKDAPKVGGAIPNDQAVKKAAPDPTKALAGVLENPDKVDKVPDPERTAKTKKELEAQPKKADPVKVAPPKMAAAPDRENDPKKLLATITDPNFKTPKPVVVKPQPKPTLPPPQPKPTPPPPQVKPAPPPPTPEQLQAAEDRRTLEILKQNVPGGDMGENGPPPAPTPAPKPAPRPEVQKPVVAVVGPGVTPKPVTTVQPRPQPLPQPQQPVVRPQPQPLAQNAPVTKPNGAPGNPGPRTAPAPTALRNGQPRVDRVVTHNQDLKERDQVVNENMRQLDDEISFELEGPPDPKDAIPGIFIANTSEDEWKDIISHFDLCPIAYPDTKDYFVLIDLVTQTLQKAKGEEAFNGLKARYASSGIAFTKRKLWSTAVFSGAAVKACETYGIPKDQVNLMILAPKQVMSYMAWKSLKTVRDEGYEPTKVRACHARFSRTTDGWILKVTDLVLEDGSVHQVRT